MNGHFNHKKEKTMDTDNFMFEYTENKAPVEHNEKWGGKG